MKYGYVRVSSITQNIARQMEEMKKYGLTNDVIYVDKQSGKDFERKNYQLLKSKLKKNDVVVIKSINRLGRNYNMIIEEWIELTKVIGVNIYVINFPLLNTSFDENNLIGKFISDIVLQVLSFVAENERVNIKQRQAEGIKIAKENGKHMGRPEYILPNDFKDIANKFYNKQITNKEAANLLNISRGTFLKYAKKYK